MGRNILILIVLALVAAPGVAGTVKYFKLNEYKEITEDEARRSKYRLEIYDDDGNEISEGYFNAAGEAITETGVHLVEYAYDGRGNRTAEVRWGLGGEAAAWDSVHKREWKYD
ncbi:MAG TPA: hypothetical protein VMX79_07500, partial [bacterium]|nr:hypothetical protein [bacterium]